MATNPPSPTALNPTIMDHAVYPALTNAVSAWTPLLRRASAAQLDRFAAALTPLLEALGGRLDDGAAEEERAALAAQNERIKNDWIDLHHALEDARAEVVGLGEEVVGLEEVVRARDGEVAALEEVVRARDDEVARLREACGRLRREAEQRYEEGLLVRREAVVKGARVEVLEKEVGALRARLEEARPTVGEEEEEERIPATPQHAAAAVHDHDDQDDHDDDDGPTPRYALRATKRRKLTSAGEKPRVRAAFAMLQHSLDDTADTRFALDDAALTTRQHVHAALASPDSTPTPPPPTNPLFAQTRALLLARLQLAAAAGPVHVDQLRARHPVAQLLDASIADLIEGEDGGGRAAEQRARRAARWADGAAGVGYCLGGALRTRRRPDFVDGEGRACKECVAGGRPCLVRVEGSGEVVALPWGGAGAEATWRDVGMWKGEGGGGRDGGAAGVVGKRKRKRRG
ncbi:hypothetical protein SLS56_008603 [Neofusicoccum ribis]|uniref:Uncharacterized protein n=1 Tax=Neofusicoccum ribis TaxID=45134 RepID=A0ABR3SJM1_9PEZI